MVPVFHNEHSSERGNSGGGWSEGQVGLGVAIGTAVIVAVVVLFAMAGPALGIGPRLPAVAYLLIAISAVMILASYMIPLIRNTARAGLYLSAFWLLAIFVLFVVFRYFG